MAANATTYYVSTSGSDSNPGTITQPWKTWQKGFNSLSGGDILYIRGGSYTGMYDSRHGVYISNRDGSSSNVITVAAYPGEVPVLDCSSLSSSSGVNFGILMRGCDYWLIKGLTVKSVREYNNLSKSSGGSPVDGWELGDCNYITLEQCIVTDCGNGFSLNGTLHEIHYLNCDSYLNYDYYDNGGLANGYNGNVRSNSTIFYDGCKAWSNSDDGYDDYGGAGYIVYRNCWAFGNGKGTTTMGNGDGFKLGYDNSSTELPGNQRTLYNCISADNTLMGFDESMDATTSMDMALYNCISYMNSSDFGFRFSVSYGTGVTTLRNNISYSNGINYAGRSRNISDHNSWDAGAPAVSDGDFTSLDFSQLSRPRKSDGSLPDVDFSKLASSSDLIDAGVNVGSPFTGKAPDLGAFETQVSTVPMANVAYVSSSVKNTSASELELVYDQTLANIIPSTSCFDVKVNNVSRTISNLTISDKNVYLTLSSPVKYGEAVALSYSKPSTNPLQCTAGTLAETISGKTVTNLVEPPAPVYMNSVVENTSPDKIEILYDAKLANVIPPSTSFVPKVNGLNKTVKAVAITDNVVTITLADPLSGSDTITVAYTKPSTNPLQSVLGVKAESLPDKPVANDIVGVITEIPPVVNDGKILIFPNPAKDFIQIANFNAANQNPVLRIFDFSGKLIQEIKIDNTTNLKNVPIVLKTGIYKTQLFMGEVVQYIQKLIVVK